MYSKMYKLKDWVDETQLNTTLSKNERAVEYLESHKYLIDNEHIFCNENAIHIIEKRLRYDEKGYVNVNYNKNAVNFLRNNPQYIAYEILFCEEHGIGIVDDYMKDYALDKIVFKYLSKNPAAMHILNDPKYYKYIDWIEIIYNKNAHDIVKNNIHMVEQYWPNICKQPHLIDIIECNMDKIDWCVLSENENAVHILEKNIDKTYDISLRYNKNGFKLLLSKNHDFKNNLYYHKNIVFEYFDYCEKNNIPFTLIKKLSEYGYTEKHMEFLQHNNNYLWLSMNPNIFEYDYKRMRETRQSLLWYNDIKN